MSHVTVVDIEIKDLKALKEVCDELGLEFREGQTTFKWYGRHIGDYPLPPGFTKEDMGKCDHAISVEGVAGAYEVGVVRRRDGKPGYHLMWDFWSGGYGLEAAVGKDCSKLCQGYAAKMVAKHSKALIAKGFTLKKSVNAAGEIVMQFVK